MNKQLTILLLSGALFAGTRSFAQDKVEAASSEPSSYALQKLQDSVFERPFFKRPSAISLNLGTQGFGLDYKIRATHNWYFRLGFDLIPINYPTKLTIDGYSSDLKLNTNVTNVHLLAEWQPFYKSGFRVVGGAAYFASAEVKGTLQPNGTYKYGDIDVTGNIEIVEKVQFLMNEGDSGVQRFRDAEGGADPQHHRIFGSGAARRVRGVRLSRSPPFTTAR